MSTVEADISGPPHEKGLENQLQVSSLEKHEVEIHVEKGHFIPEVFFLDKNVVNVDGVPEDMNPKAPLFDVTAANHHPMKEEPDICLEPKVGIEFDSEEHAYECYSRYAVLQGFSIRKDFVNRSKVNGSVASRRYTCHRQGYRKSKCNENVIKPHEETRTGCLAHMTISRRSNGKYCVTRFVTEHNHTLATSTTAHKLSSLKRVSFGQAVEAEVANASVMDGVPKLGMSFDSEDYAYEFYNTYAGTVGFSVRKDYVNRSKVDGAVGSRRFTCYREGFRQNNKQGVNVKRSRKETRIGCSAQLIIVCQPDGKYRVTHFEENHNHELVAARMVHTLRSQKRSANSQVVVANGIDFSKLHPISASGLLCRQDMDQVDLVYNPVDYKNSLKSKRAREMSDREAESILQYFQSKRLKDSSFFYAIQLDAEEQITNVFWADKKMLVDYSDFGDVVCVDTTYRLKDCRPFAPFIGVNHHKQMVIFGAALLHDETVESFKWLFHTFIEAMSGKKPKTILTDQGAVIAEAIRSVLPETHHRMCVWHVYQNALKHLSDSFLRLGSFVNDFCSCIFDHDEEEDFLDAWKVMLDRYHLWENGWLQELFKEREKWATAYRRHIFCADVKNVLLCENFHTSLRKCLKSDLDVLQFFKHLVRVLNTCHSKELEANHNMSKDQPSLMGDVILLKHARDVYTPKMFELFQQEYEQCLNVVVNPCSECEPLFEYNVSIYGQPRKYKVIYNASESTVSCSCLKFEFAGILCCHALKVLDYRNIKVVPDQYILKRWTRDARL